MDGVDVVRYRYAPARWERLVNDGGVVTNLKKRPWTMLLVPFFLIAQAWAVLAEIRKGDVAVVHAHWLIPQGLLMALLRRFKLVQTPFLVTSHGADLFALKGRVMTAGKRLVLEEASSITVVSEAMREPLRQLGVEQSRVHVEPMGVDLSDRFFEDATVERSKNQLLFVGRIVEKKGLRHLIDALPLVRKERPDVELVVVGFGPDAEACRLQAIELGLSEHVRFVGPVQQAELPNYYRRAALFVAPFVEAASGDQEGLGLVVVEAMGCGCPVVVSELAATRELLSLHSGITRAAPADPKSIAQAILEALVSPAPTRPDLSHFDWKTRAESYSALLNSMDQSST